MDNNKTNKKETIKFEDVKIEINECKEDVVTVSRRRPDLDEEF